MDKGQLIEYSIAKDGAYLDFPFSGGDYATVKIKNNKTGKYRIFAEIFTLNNKDYLTFSTDEETAFALRNSYPNLVTKGYHCPPVQAKFKSSVDIANMDNKSIKKFVDISYLRAKKMLKIL